MGRSLSIYLIYGIRTQSSEQELDSELDQVIAKLLPQEYAEFQYCWSQRVESHIKDSNGKLIQNPKYTQYIENVYKPAITKYNAAINERFGCVPDIVCDGDDYYNNAHLYAYSFSIESYNGDFKTLFEKQQNLDARIDYSKVDTSLKELAKAMNAELTDEQLNPSWYFVSYYG
jgi:hypothetical protein